MNDTTAQSSPCICCNTSTEPHGYLRGQVGGVRQPRPKPCPITSTDRPGLPNFSHSNVEKYWKAWVRGSLTGQMFEEGRERLVTVVNFPCARGISLTASLTCCHETNMR